MIREGRWLPPRKDDDGIMNEKKNGGRRVAGIVMKVRKDVCFHVGRDVTGGRRKGLF